MNLRLPVSAKALLTEAARRSGLSLSEYVLRHSMQAAHEQLAQARYTPLSERDAQALAQRLEDADAPSEGLEQALRTYRKRVTDVRE